MPTFFQSNSDLHQSVSATAIPLLLLLSTSSSTLFITRLRSNQRIYFSIERVSMNMSIKFSKKANIGSVFLLFCPTLSYLYLLLCTFAALTATTMSACHLVWITIYIHSVTAFSCYSKRRQICSNRKSAGAADFISWNWTSWIPPLWC